MELSPRAGKVYARALLLFAAGSVPTLAQAPLEEPFTPSRRWSHYLHRTYAPSRMGRLAAETVVDQLLLEPGCWDSSAGSYGRRYLRAFERRAIRNTAEFAAGAITGEDLRYRASRSRSVPGRAWSAVRAAGTARMPDGSRRPAYTRFFAGTLADISTAHWTGRPIRTGWLLRSRGWSMLDQMQTNLLDEFGPDLRRVGMRLWRRVKRDEAKPVPRP